MNLQDQSLDELCINTLRFLSIDAVQQANSGHPGLPMGAAPMAYVLWTKFLQHSPRNPGWPNRDRFVLSAGHGSILLYSLLHLCGYDLSLDELKDFRQWQSKTPGHPEYGDTPGVETTTVNILIDTPVRYMGKGKKAQPYTQWDARFILNSVNPLTLSYGPSGEAIIGADGDDFRFELWTFDQRRGTFGDFLGFYTMPFQLTITKRE